MMKLLSILLTIWLHVYSLILNMNKNEMKRKHSFFINHVTNEHKLQQSINFYETSHTL